MRLFTHSIFIARSREEVFDYFIDFSKAPRWRSYVRSMELIGGGPVKAGSRISATMDLMGKEHKYELKVLVCERPSLWRHHTDETDFRGHIEYRFETEGAGTRATMSMHVRPVSLYGWLGLPLMLLRRSQSYKDQLPQLKRAVEEQQHPG